MKITRQEVKTFYTIEYTAQDLKEAVAAYHASEAQSVCYPNAYGNMDPEAMENPDTLEKIYRDMGGYGSKYGSHGDTYKALAYHFGFDGWEHCGSYNKHTKTRTMTVYNEGDHLSR